MIVCGGSCFKKGKNLAMFPAKALINGFCSNGNSEEESKPSAGIMFLLLCASHYSECSGFMLQIRSNNTVPFQLVW